MVSVLDILTWIQCLMFTVIVIKTMSDGSVTDISLVQMDEILIDFRCDCIVRNQCLNLLLVLFHVIGNH